MKKEPDFFETNKNFTENDLRQILEICDKYWKIFTLDENLNLSDSLKDFTALVKKEVYDLDIGFKNHKEYLDIIIVSYRRRIQQEISKQRSISNK